MKFRFLFILIPLGFFACTTEPLFNFAVRGSLTPVGDRGTGGADNLEVSIFSFYVAATPECISPQVVIDYGGDPLIKDFGGDPVMFSGKLENGSYPCGILQVSDTLRFRPDETARGAFGACEDLLYPSDGYAADVVNFWKDLSGDPVTAAGSALNPSGSIVTLFLTTDPEALKEARDLEDGQIIELTEPYTVPGELTVFFDLANRVGTDSGVCVLEQPFAQLGLR